MHFDHYLVLVRIALISVVTFLVGCGPPGLATLSTSQAYYSQTKYSGKASSRTGKRCLKVLPAIERLGDKFGVDHSLVVGVVRVESRFNPRARSRSGAVGLMQVMPSTGRWFKCGSLGDVENNLECGIRILKRYIEKFDGNLTYGLAAYNAGPRHAARYRRAGILPKNYSYVEKVLKTRNRFISKGCH